MCEQCREGGLSEYCHDVQLSGSKSTLIDGLACCPFCGGAVELVDRDATFTIECETCRVTMNCFSMPTLVHRWNFRAG